MQFRIVCFVFLISLFFGSLLFAGTTGKIAGIVKDKENGEPLIGANVFIEGTALGSTSDLDGSYFIINVPPGTYTVVVQYIGYREVRVSGLQVSIDLTTKQDFRLSTETVDIGEAVVVTAERDVVQKDLTSSESRVSSERIQQLPVAEVADVLQIQPGVTRDADGGFHIRGGRSSEIGYWINGVSITDSYDNSQGLVIENEGIQELQVISGTFNAEYGNAMSGIVNVVTKEGDNEYHGNFEVYSGDYFAKDDGIFFNVDDRAPAENYSFQGSLSGPVPFLGNKFRFYATGRHTYNDGALYGLKVFNPDGNFAKEFTEEDVQRIETFESDEDVFNFLTEKFDAVPMDWSERTTGLANLTFQATPTLKFNIEGRFSTEDFRDYNHDFRLNPDGDVSKFNDSYNGSFIVNHTLSSRTFYTLNLTYLNREFNEFLYEDPSDPRYQDPDLIQNVPPGNFNVGGTNFHQFFRKTENYIGKLDLTSQFHRAHLLKGGIEIRYSRLEQDDYDLLPPNDAAGISAIVPGISFPTRDIFTAEPIQYSVYLQDKFEHDKVIINAGLRLDYFDSRGDILADPRDPDIFRPILQENQAMTLEERQQVWYNKADAKVQLSPRLGIAYPISADGVIHFSFGHFLQVPELRHLFQNSQYKLAEVGNPADAYGNPDLDAQSTVQYEIGLQQQFARNAKIDLTLFYRDIRDWITTDAPTETYRAGSIYYQFTNRDYANVRGVTLSYNHRFTNNFLVDAVYQFQSAEGTNSNADEEFQQRNNNFEPTVQLTPLDWDQTHNINLSVYYGGRTWGISTIGRFNTGLPFTPATNVDLEVTVGPNATNDNPKNSRRKPSNFVVDMRLHKSFPISGDMKARLFGRVFNLFDKRNEADVFDDTGRAGFTLLQPTSGNSVFFVRPDFYSPPREVQVGFEFDF